MGIPCADARSTQTDYETLLPVDHAARFGEVLLNTAKVILVTHRKLTPPAGKKCAHPAFNEAPDCGKRCEVAEPLKRSGTSLAWRFLLRA